MCPAGASARREIAASSHLRDDKFGREEAPGVGSAIDGICTVDRRADSLQKRT